MSLQDLTQKVTLQGGMIRIFLKLEMRNWRVTQLSQDPQEKPVQAGCAGASQHSSCRAWGRSLWNGGVSRPATRPTSARECLCGQILDRQIRTLLIAREERSFSFYSLLEGREL